MQFDTEIVKREIGNGDATGDVLEIKHLSLKLLQLLATIHQVIHLAGFLRLEHVLFTGRAGVQKCHAPLHTVFELNVLVKIDVRPEVHKLDLLVG